MISIKNFHTFRCDVYADQMIEIIEAEQLTDLFHRDFFASEKWLFLGGGSNVLFTGDFRGTILLNMLKGREIVETLDGYTRIRFASGENWHSSVLWTLKKGYNGLENLSLIPGTVGAAPMQNIGAYGVELKDVFHSLQAFDIKTGDIVTFFNDECRFGYRESIFKHEHRNTMIIISVDLLLKTDGVTNVSYGDILKTLETMACSFPYKATDVSQAVISIRQNKLPDPEILGNAGSFFKNPVIGPDHYNKLKAKFPDMPAYVISDHEIKIPAGWLIEQSGFKGKRFGDTGAHEKQALVLVNYGEATGSDILELAAAIQKEVRERFDINIDPEVNVIE